MRFLLIGDCFGIAGRNIVKENLPRLRNELGINFTIINGENIAHGKGIIEKYYKELLSQNIDVVTLGNHAFSNKNIFTFINDAKRLIRPCNFKETMSGNDYLIINYNGIKILLFQVLGQVFMNDEYLNPFLKAEEILNKAEYDIAICDFHGEATSEKNAFGLYFDGKINIITGTHTHVQTNDARILPKGSFYISDIGMCGALNGVIGVEEECVIHQYLTGEHIRHKPKNDGLMQFNAVMVEINEKNKKITKYELINLVQ